ncbi:Rossmann-like and DUF2520 domain-containing protein [Microbacterium sp. 179-I 3D4 NHS]|uniref:Rossmann-like and DUF2520 domain-containing protein n=1 Tax=Microbacterium sp. 179-I 3D4 NHS TaxID=3142381 RepID=UPI0039A21999
MSSTPPPAASATIAVVGAGRLGRVLAQALEAAGYTVHGPLRRRQGIPDADIVLLCVPDSAIPDVAADARPRARLVGHVSGATPLTHVDFSVHPLQTFTGREGPEAFRGIGVAIDGRTRTARKTAERLALALGAKPFIVDDAHRASYHAAASFASNFVLTVLDAAEHLGRDAGLDRAHLAPLVRQTVDNWLAHGASNALTGPLTRGDEATVERQRAAASALDLAPLFDALATATREIAARSADGDAPVHLTPAKDPA